MTFALNVLVVFAAASLHGAFSDAGAQFEKAHPGVAVRFDFDGSQILETQLANGAPADVFASADLRWMHAAQTQRLVAPPIAFAGNAIVAVAAAASHDRTLQDLARPGARVDICADSVPCGRYARYVLGRVHLTTAVMRNVVSNELDVEAVLTKVELGAVEAGFVYATDARAAGASVRLIPIPHWAQPSISYPIAVTSGSAHAALARAFVSFLRARAGQAILRKYGFAPVR